MHETGFISGSRTIFHRLTDYQLDDKQQHIPVWAEQITGLRKEHLFELEYSEFLFENYELLKSTIWILKQDS